MGFVSTTGNKVVRLKISVRPRSKRTLLLGLHDNRVKMSVTAPPVDGKANAEVIAYLADFFDLKKRDICVVSGHTSQKKICHIEKLSEEVVRLKIKGHLKLP